MHSKWASSNFWGTFWGQFSIELIGGIIGSFIFLFVVLILFKPKIKICDFICLGQYPQAGSGSFYSFKFVNKSFFSAHDVGIELYKLQKIPMGNKLINNRYNELSLLLDYLTHVPARKTIWNKSVDNSHCVVFRTTENIKEILAVDTDVILVKVSLKHGLTGLTKVFEQEYCNV